MQVLVTGSSGLIGSTAVEFYDQRGASVVGLDNNMRAHFFGIAGDTTWNLKRLQSTCHSFQHFDADIRDWKVILELFETYRFDLVLHCAAQPSHDKAAEIPLVDFEVNALGTVNLLEATRRHCPDAVFVHMSTNKVYGDVPNRFPMTELEMRYDYAEADRVNGIDESCPIDQSLHSIFGASKVAADIMAQEYGRYFGIKTGVFRGGCLTGSSHSGVEAHGFLNYLVRMALSGSRYTVYGYKGKQVRDNIHCTDVITAVEAFRQDPRPGEVYNIGGGRENSISVLEAIKAIEDLSARRIDWNYSEMNRRGDHICYISDSRKFRSHFPGWNISQSLENILADMVRTEAERKP